MFSNAINIIARYTDSIRHYIMPNSIIIGSHTLIKVNEKEVKDKLSSCVSCKKQISFENTKGVVLPCGDLLDINCYNNCIKDLKNRCIKCDAIFDAVFIAKNNDIYATKEQYKQDKTILKCTTKDCYYAISEKQYLTAKNTDDNQTASAEIIKIKEASKTCPYNEINFSHEPGSSKKLIEPDNLNKIKEFLVKLMYDKGIPCSGSVIKDDSNSSISIRTESIHTCAEYDMNDYVNENLSAHNAFSKFINDVEKDLLFLQLYKLYPEFFVKNSSIDPRLDSRANDEFTVFNSYDPDNSQKIYFDDFIDSSKMSFDFDKLKQKCNEYHKNLYAHLFTIVHCDAYCITTQKDMIFTHIKNTLDALPSGKLPASKFIMLPILKYNPRHKIRKFLI